MMALLLAATLAAGEGRAVPADDRWLRVKADGLELYTDASPGQATAAAARLQRFAQVLRRAAPAPPVERGGATAVVLAFARAGDFRAVAPMQGSRADDVDGFVQGGALRTLVAVNLESSRAQPLETLDHEYVHLALNGALPAQPLWVAEGLAELYSDWTEAQGIVRLGATRETHERLLRERALIPMDRLLAAGYTSPEFVDPQRRQVLYAQSWALARLVLDGGSEQGRRRLLAYLGLIAAGRPPAEALQDGLGWSLAEATARLLRSLLDAPDAITFAAADTPAPAPVAEPAPAGLVDAFTGELLVRQNRDAEARRRFQRALEADPGLAAAHESLAQIALRAGRREEARAHLDRALDLQPGDPAALFRRAELLAREAGSRGETLSGAAEEEVVALLERAVAAAPHHADAVILLAQLRPQPRGRRLRMVEQALALNPARSDLGLALAALHLNAQDPARAAAALVRARDGSRDDAQRFVSEHLLRRLGQVTAGTAETTGRFLALECQPGGALDFVVEAEPGPIGGGVDFVMHGGGAARPAGPARGPRPLRLRAQSPSAVLLQDSNGDTVQPELICGVQEAGAVRVRYRPLPAGGPEGALLSLQFLQRG